MKNTNLNMKKVLLVVSLMVITCFTLTFKGYPANDDAVPKNIILLIGDGMGVGLVTSAKVVAGNLNLEKLTTVGLLTTHAQDAFLNTSEGSGTALATGVFTKKKYIAISPLKQPVTTVLEHAEKKGKSTGIVVTSTIVDATPACFFAHVDSRHKRSFIADRVAQSGIEVLLGGGLGYFIPRSQPESRRMDERDLISEMEGRYKIVTTAEGFRKVGNVERLLGIFSPAGLPFADKREISLTEMVEKSISILSKNKKGFFLLVEGSAIDWAAHHGNSELMIQEMIDLDNAVGAAFNFAERDGQTLVILTSDHETSGYFPVEGSVKEKTIRIAISATKDHTAAMVPLFAYGPGSHQLSGIHPNTYVGKTLIDYVTRSN